MSILTINTNTTGFTGDTVKPRRCVMTTTDDVDTITSAGYLNKEAKSGQGIQPNDVFKTLYNMSPNSNKGTYGKFYNSFNSSTGYTLVSAGTPGVVLPVIEGDIPKFNGESGQLIDSGILPENVLMVDSVVDDYQEFLGIKDILMETTGTWTITRVTSGNYALVKDAEAKTAVVGIDATAKIRSVTDKGFKLNSIDFIYKTEVQALNAHSATLSKIVYDDKVAVAVSSIGITGTLSTAVNPNEETSVSNISVNTPDYLNDNNAKYIVEVTVNSAATSIYYFYGIVLRYSKTVA